MNISSPSDLLIDQIRDLFSVESQVVVTMPELASHASDHDLRELLALQEGICIRQKERLEEAASLLGESPEGDLSKAMAGLIEGGNAHIEKATEDLTRDLILVAHVNRIYHYEMAGYGFATALAAQLEHSEVEALLRESLEEEKAGATVLAETGLKVFTVIEAETEGW